MSRNQALDQIKETLKEIFNGGYPVVRDADFDTVPDNKQTKLVIGASDWTEEEVRSVITDGGKGRTYRNTLVFVQPTDSVLETRTVEKARDLEAALRVHRDDTIDPELRKDARERSEREQKDLRERIEVRYGEVLKGDNLLMGFEEAEPTRFNALGVGPDAEEIASEMKAGQFKLSQSIRDEALNLLDRRGEATVVDIYEQFLRRPGLPIPSSADAILEVMDELRGESVLVHTADRGFLPEFRVTATTDRLVNADDVEAWETDDIEGELQQRLKKSVVNFDEFVDEIRTRTDVRLTGDPATAAEQLRDSGVCVFVNDRETTSRPAGAELRTDVSVVDADELAEEIRAQIADTGRARIQEVLAGLPETVVFDNIQQTVRDAVETLLEGPYLIEDRYENTLRNGTNPLGVTLVPTVDATTGEEILDRIRGYDEGDEFSLFDVAGEVDERKARTFLLQHLGPDDPAYLLEGGSSSPADWSSGTYFQIPGGTWSFEDFFGHPDELRETWASAREEGETTEGTLRFTLPGDHTSAGFGDVVEVQDATTTVELSIEPGQPVVHVTRLFGAVPEDAIDIEARFEFNS